MCGLGPFPCPVPAADIDLGSHAVRARVSAQTGFLMSVNSHRYQTESERVIAH